MTLQLDLAAAPVAPWRGRAACAGHPVDWWFARPATSLAAAICASCPVRNECDADADRHGDGGFRAWRTRNPTPILCDGCRQPLGVVELAGGGTVCDSICAEAAHHRRWDAMGHGRVATYNAGCPCDGCRTAARDTKRASRARRNTTSSEGPGYGPRTEGEQQ